MIRLETLDKDEMPEPEKDKGIKIGYKGFEFVFFPRIIVSDKDKKTIFGIKFNYAERLVLFWRTPDKIEEDSKIDEFLQMFTPGLKESNFEIRNVMDYIPEIYETAVKIGKGELPLKDGPHPDWKDRE
jgi:hypothetical protein